MFVTVPSETVFGLFASLEGVRAGLTRGPGRGVGPVEVALWLGNC